MLPELANFALILAVLLPISQLLIDKSYQTTYPNTYLYGQSFFLGLALIILAYCLVTDDFSVLYVANNSNSSLSTAYKITAIWGAHEGSMLLWCASMSAWGLVASYILKDHSIKVRKLSAAYITYSVALFIIIVLCSSNPFARLLLSMPLDGADLNPLLQDIGMTIHPPLLYAGYVGSIAPVAYTFACIYYNKLDTTWAKTCVYLLSYNFAFLTIGIALGSWWSYYELGWGGWWVWDPVENASLMPWLAYLLSLHFLSIAKVSGKFIKLNIALQLCIFALSIFGTFILRSGLATSVHSFASDPLRGFFIVLGGVGVLLPYIYYAFHMHYISNKTKVAHPLERYIKIGMLLVFIILIVVFVGTMYPILDIRVSVRANFFNLIIVPLVLMLMSLMLVGFNKSAPIKPAKVLYVAIFSILAMYLYFGFIKILALLGVFLANLMICQLLFASKSKHFKLGHIGFCITVLGLSLSPNYEIELERLLEVGDSVNLHKYVINFVDIQTLAQANNIADIAKFDIFQAGKLIKTLSPQRRIYVAQELVTAETAIWSGIFQDVCISISEELENGWAVRLCYKPFVRLIWLGGIVMATAAFSKRKLNVK